MPVSFTVFLFQPDAFIGRSRSFKSVMYKISGALLALFTLTACTTAPVQRHDYSKMQQDDFTEVVKQVRGNTRYLSSNLTEGHRLSTALMQGKRRGELEALFRDNGGRCARPDAANIMHCSVNRWWAYTDVRMSPDREKICKPGMQLNYSLYFDEVEQASAVLAKLNVDVTHLAHCPDEVTRHLLSDPYRATGVPVF